MKIRNISDHVIEKQESGLSFSLQPGEEAQVMHRINAESWETEFPGQVARIYEPDIDGPNPPFAPPGVIIIGLNDNEPEEEPADEDTPPDAPELSEDEEESKEAQDTPKTAQVMLETLPEYTRVELNQIAEKVGIEDPAAYKTKPALIDAIKGNAGDQNYIEV